MKPHNDIFWFDSLTSTQDYLTGLLSELKGGSVVAAREQTAGRGLTDNKWYSTPGESLTFSYLLSPGSIHASRQYIISMAVAVALKSFFAHETGDQVYIKWPNDILVQKGKIAGILIQHHLMGENILYSMIGVGLNLNMETFPAWIPNPVSLKMITGKQYNPEKVLETLKSSLDRQLHPNNLLEPNQLRNHFLNSLFQYKTRHKYKIRGEIMFATIEGITDFGLLILKDDDGCTYECDLKEVVYYY